MMGLGKPHQPANFEVVTFRNIKRETQFWGAALAHGHAHVCSWCDFMMALGKPKLFYQI